MKQNPGKILSKTLVYTARLAEAIPIIGPVDWVVKASAKKYSAFSGKAMSPGSFPETCRYQHAVTAYREPNMGSVFRNAVNGTATALVLLLIFVHTASHVEARFDTIGSKILYGAFIAGLAVNINNIVVPICLMLSSANRALGDAFFMHNRLRLEIIYTTSARPMTVYLLSRYFKTLPKGCEEAAYIDGWGYFKTMTKILVPMAKPSIMTVILSNLLSFWNAYTIAYTLMDGKDTLAMGL